MEIVDHIYKLPALSEEAIHIWGVHVPEVQDRAAEIESVLSAREREKAARFRREADRASSIAARGALRILLSGYSGLPAPAITFSYTDNGKPFIKNSDIAFNLSHSAEWVLIAISQGRKIGVDIEKVKRTMKVERVAERYFSAEEQSAIQTSADPCALFFELWARKEAYVKACGSTLFSELKRISVPIEATAEKDGWFFHRLEAGSKYAAAVVSDKPMEKLPCYNFGASFRDGASGETFTK
ncbi:MAG: 4'-phosphopantetheinyl transferase superfamily protein [Pontiellaceae bacterium]|nr:4'-phosphopantetheinyl transferase superfamily protein [Pontiellaceae bacterium]